MRVLEDVTVTVEKNKDGTHSGMALGKNAVSLFVVSETEMGVVDEIFEGLRKIAVKELK